MTFRIKRYKSDLSWRKFANRGFYLFPTTLILKLFHIFKNSCSMLSSLYFELKPYRLFPPKVSFDMPNWYVQFESHRNFNSSILTAFVNLSIRLFNKSVKRGAISNRSIHFLETRNKRLDTENANFAVDRWIQESIWFSQHVSVSIVCEDSSMIDFRANI